MTFSQYAGTAIVPTLARIVLAVAFVSAGWNMVFEDDTFTAEEATRLRNLGITPEPENPPKVVRSDLPLQIVLAAHRVQDPLPNASSAGSLRDSPPPAGDPAAQTKPADAPPSTSGAAPPPVAETSAPQPQAHLEPLPPGTYKAQGLHHVTLLLSENHVPQPVWMARLAAFTELVGGAMLLLGLFSRIWGLGLAIAMGAAFYFVSMKTNGIFTMDPRVFASDHARYSMAYLQAGLFVLAFGIFLTGPGPLSLDRMLFGGGGERLEPGEVRLD